MLVRLALLPPRLTAKMTVLGSPKTKKSNGGGSFWDKVALATRDCQKTTRIKHKMDAGLPLALAARMRTSSSLGHRAERIHLMSRSRTFLRNVFRFSPKSSAALIWLPRVAASAAEINGYSISRKIR
jgi:hypothetical protein